MAGNGTTNEFLSLIHGQAGCLFFLSLPATVHELKRIKELVRAFNRIPFFLFQTHHMFVLSLGVVGLEKEGICWPGVVPEHAAAATAST